MKRMTKMMFARARGEQTNNRERYDHDQRSEYRNEYRGMENQTTNRYRNEAYDGNGVRAYSGSPRSYGRNEMTDSIGFKGNNYEAAYPRNNQDSYRRSDYEDAQMQFGGGRQHENPQHMTHGRPANSRWQQEDEEEPELDEMTAEKWVKSMKSESGQQGPRWSKEQTKQVLSQIGGQGIDPNEFYAVMNAMYSDYSEVMRKFGMDKQEVYGCLAKAWLKDKDAVENKAAMYYKCIVKH